MRLGQKDWVFVSSNEDAASIRFGYEGAEIKRRSFPFTGPSRFQNFAYDHKMWVVTIRMRVRIQEAEN